jgi:CheY-like chemotaxis protein
MICGNVRLGTKLIDDLLDLKRLSLGTLQVQSEPVDMNEVVLHVCGMCRPQLQKKAIRLHCALDENAGSVTADPGRLQQILRNLVDNAASLTPPGGAVHVHTSRMNVRQVSVQVRDTGIGISADELPRVFEALGGGTRIARSLEGLGFGLAVCRGLAQLLNGTICAESPGPGMGSTFTVTLPAAATIEDPATPRKPVDRAADRGHGRVLLVDDHADTSAMIARMLRSSGYSVTTADCVTGALQLADKQPFDVLVTDVGLPDGTGYELMEQIRENHAMRGIALSGYGMDEDIRRGRDAGFSDHLVKPVDVEQLLQAIHRVLHACP